MVWLAPFLPVLGSISAGTKVETVRGFIRVEMLTPGDWIATGDGGGAILRGLKCHARHLSQRGLRDKPILIKAGVLGSRLPHADLIVAPGQRVSLSGTAVTVPDSNGNDLVPAARLRTLAGVRLMKGRRKLSLFSLHFDRPCLVRAEGCALETGQTWFSRWISDICGKRLDASGGQLMRRPTLPKPAAVQTTYTLPWLNLEPGKVNDMQSRHDQDLLEWDRDLAAEQHEAAERAAEFREAELKAAPDARRGAA